VLLLLQLQLSFILVPGKQKDNGFAREEAITWSMLARGLSVDKVLPPLLLLLLMYGSECKLA
jgi:hypothetical protein